MASATKELQKAKEVLRERLGPLLEGEASLEAQLLDDCKAARSRWPEIKLCLRPYFDFIAGQGQETDSPFSASEYPHRQELFVTLACIASDPPALDLLDNQYLPKIKQHLLRLYPSPQQLEDLMQSLREQLLLGSPGSPALFLKFSGRGKLESWLRVVALRLATRQLKADRQERVQRLTERLDEALPCSCPDPELLLLKKTYREEFSRSFQVAVASLSDRDRTVLTLHLVEGLLPGQISEIYGVHRTTVVRWLAAAQSRVIEQTMESMKASLTINDDELRSIFRLIQSQVSLPL